MLMLNPGPIPLLLPAWTGSGKRLVYAERHTALPLDTVTCSDALAFLRTLPSESVNCVVTSPPYYGLRQYLFDGAVVMRSDLSQEDQEYVRRELERLGIKPR